MSEPRRVPLLILGTGSFAEEVAAIAAETPPFEVAGFVENWDRRKCDAPFLGLPVHWIDAIDGMAPSHRAVCALGTTKRRAYIESVAAKGFEFATLVHPSARFLGGPDVGAGSVVNLGVLVASRTRIGRHVLLNRGALVGHHTTIGDFCTIGPGANVAASVDVGEGTYVGMGAVIRDHVRVGRGAVVGAGAVVVRDVPDRVQVVGVPAQVAREGVDGL